MNNNSQLKSDGSTSLERKALLTCARVCPLCTGQWVSLGGLSKCIVCGYTNCEGCGEGSQHLESR